MPRHEHACVQCCLIQKLLRNLYPSSSIVSNEVYITISNHNNQRKIREKDADLLWNRSSCQCDFNHLPFYCKFMVYIALVVHVFLSFPNANLATECSVYCLCPGFFHRTKCMYPNLRSGLIKSNRPPNAVSQTEEACVSRCLIQRHQ